MPVTYNKSPGPGSLEISFTWITLPVWYSSAKPSPSTVALTFINPVPLFVNVGWDKTPFAILHCNCASIVFLLSVIVMLGAAE